MSAKSGGTKSSRKQDGVKVVADNRRARFDYEIIDTFEAGIELKGPEVKSLREGRANIGESYASVNGGELYLIYLGRALVERGHSVTLWASSHPRMDELASSFAAICGSLARSGLLIS